MGLIFFGFRIISIFSCTVDSKNETESVPRIIPGPRPSRRDRHRNRNNREPSLRQFDYGGDFTIKKKTKKNTFIGDGLFELFDSIWNGRIVGKHSIVSNGRRTEKKKRKTPPRSELVGVPSKADGVVGTDSKWLRRWRNYRFARLLIWYG